ncbi:MAG: YtxH domain-containing protein [Chlorobiales bacterium]|nr:YtxH domain-containing protein [Chlorobiales bacterium]
MQKDNFFKGFVVGAFMGAAAGTIIGLLFAPRKGSETQQALTDGIGYLIDQTKQLSRNLTGSVTASTEADDADNDAKIRSQAVIETARSEAEQLLNDADVILREIKHQAKQNRN